MGKAVMAGIILLATFTQVKAVDLNQLTRDTQRTSQVADQWTLVWWMPPAYWEASLTNPKLTSEGRQQILAVLDDYMIFAVLRAKVATTGAIAAQSKAEMVSNSRLEANGTKIDPIPSEDIAPRAQAILVALKPIFSNMLGQLGQSVELVVYPGKQDGRRIVDATQKGSLQYTLYDQAFTWQLPLPSLLPVKVDPKTGAEFPCDYEFNPYTGTPLVNVQPAEVRNALPHTQPTAIPTSVGLLCQSSSSCPGTLHCINGQCVDFAGRPAEGWHGSSVGSDCASSSECDGQLLCLNGRCSVAK